MAFTPVIYAPLSQVESANLNAIQSAIVDLETVVEYAPGIVGVDAADISIQRCVFRRFADTVHLFFQLQWNNTVNDPASNGLNVDIDLPFESALQSGGATGIPIVSSGILTPTLSTWATKIVNAPESLQPVVTHAAVTQVLKLARIDMTDNTSPGELTVGNTLQTIYGSIVYFTNGVAIP